MENNSVSQSNDLSGPASVLVIDDDPCGLALLERQLQAQGFRVFTAADGVEGLEIMRQIGPSLVVVDLLMPRMDGLEFSRALRAAEWAGRVYIMVLTAFANEDRLVQAFEAGADDFISKPVHPRELVARLRAGQRIVDLQLAVDHQSVQLHRSHAELAIAMEKLQLMATTDELTRLLNRREALKRLRECWSASIRYGEPLSCIMIDIDHFKKVNDRHGHNAGDGVLRATADILRQAVRMTDPACRLGGEEFLIVCPRTGAAGAHVMAERIRQAIESSIIPTDGGSLRVTASLGVAESTHQMRNVDDLLAACDEALYEAKHRGRNCVVAADPVCLKVQRSAGLDRSGMHSTH